jgi:DNA-binding transcriptional ArsR family regulator
MVYYRPRLDAVFGALSDPTRRAMIARLATGETTVGELARPFPMSLPAIGKHLSVLERAGLVERWRDGRVRRVRLDPGAMRDAAGWLDEYRRLWELQLDRLAVHLGEPSLNPENATWPPHPPPTGPVSSGSSGGSPPPRSASSRRGRRRKS